MDNLVITVARGFGSCGKRIAKQMIWEYIVMRTEYLCLPLR